MRRALPAALGAALLLLSGCSGESGADFVPGPGPAKIDVDTPELRELKADARIDACAPGDGKDAVDGGLPAVTLPCLGGGQDVDLTTLRGPLVVNVWASWCGPCRTEMPVIQEFYEQYGDEVGVLGIDYQDAQTVAAMELAADSGVTYPLLADPQSDLQGKAPFPAGMKLPLFALVDEDGTTTLVAGGVDDVSELVHLVDEHLGMKL